MKKEELKNKAQLTLEKAENAIDKAKEKIDTTKDKLREKVEEGKTYVKNNPEKTKAVLAGIGAVVIAIVAFLLGRKTKNNEDKK